MLTIQIKTSLTTSNEMTLTNVDCLAADDTPNLTFTSTPSDLITEFGYTGQNISWVATDPNPNTYTIELNSSGIVAGPTVWISDEVITYNIPDGFVVGIYNYTANFTDDFGNNMTDSVLFTVLDDTTDPFVESAPNDLTVEIGYSGQSLSWMVIENNPDFCLIQHEWSGDVVEVDWTPGVEITFFIPDGFDLGGYIFNAYFVDDSGNIGYDSVTFTVVADTTNPNIISSPSDLFAELGYTGQSVSWNVTDFNPNIYTVELQGYGLVKEFAIWTSSVEITFDIPDWFTLGVYVYNFNFTDDYGNFVVENVTFTVGDTTSPTIIDAPSDLTVETGYTGQILSWTAADLNPFTYTIEFQGLGIVVESTAWTSDLAITYNIPDNLVTGIYIYTVNFTDDYGNFITDSFTFIIEDAVIDDLTSPIINDAPNGLTVESNYVGQSLSWTATDLNPNNYTIELLGSGIVAGPTAWISGEAITYNIPDGFDVGVYIYTINFTDDYGNSIAVSVTFTIEDDSGGISGASFELFLILSIGTVVSIIILKKKNFRSDLA